ncbi:hypothetical protein GGI20_000911 [Coemansia sp. BCRC 34301]|nr:hypothetical protein GGI20_000911 [Coemansia sp. BCRC 34301]
MSLFGNLPPIETEDGNAEREAQACGGSELPAKKSTAWVRPEFAPNLRRHRAAAKPAAKQQPAPAAFEAEDGNQTCSPSVVRPPVPLLNPKHPHSLPQRPELLMSRWEAIAAAGAKPLEKAGSSGARATAALSFSLAEYLPVASRHRARHTGKRAGEAEFDPLAEYCPAAPNGYQAYKDWAAREKQRRTERQSHYEGEEGEEEDGGEDIRRDPGEPTTCIVLTNMADVVDDGLELETHEECAAFGTVVRCIASTIDDGSLAPFEQIRVFVEFAELEAAIRAQAALDQRLFDGRHISAKFVRSVVD